MKKEHLNALKCIVFAQSFVEALDEFKGSSAFRQQLKNKGKAFLKEMDKFLDTVYANGSTDASLINLIEGCQKAIDELVENDVIVIEEKTKQ